LKIAGIEQARSVGGGSRYQSKQSRHRHEDHK